MTNIVQDNSSVNNLQKFNKTNNNILLFSMAFNTVALLIIGVLLYQIFQSKNELSLQSENLTNTPTSVTSSLPNNKTIEPSSVVSEKDQLNKAVRDYLESLISGNRNKAISHISREVINDIPNTWPNEYADYETYEILNEFHSPQEEEQFYKQNEVIFQVKLYRLNEISGSAIANILFMKENGSWKTLTWYLFQ